MEEDGLVQDVLNRFGPEDRKSAVTMISLAGAQAKRSGDLYSREIAIAPKNLIYLLPEIDQILETKGQLSESLRRIEESTPQHKNEGELDWRIRVSEKHGDQRSNKGPKNNQLCGQIDKRLYGLQRIRKKILTSICKDFHDTFLAMRLTSLVEMESANLGIARKALECQEIQVPQKKEILKFVGRNNSLIQQVSEQIEKSVYSHKARRSLEKSGRRLGALVGAVMPHEYLQSWQVDAMIGGKMSGEYIGDLEEPFDLLKSPTKGYVHIELLGGLMEGKYEFNTRSVDKVYQGVTSADYDRSERVIQDTCPVYISILTSQKFKTFLDAFFKKIEEKHKDRIVSSNLLRERRRELA